MSRGRLVREGLFFTVLLGAQAVSAAETEVTVRCLELSPEDAAQVEARARANLLSAGLEPAALELSCDASSAQTQVTGNGRQVTLRAERNATAIKEALLASADSALVAWGAQSAAPATGSALTPRSAPLPPSALSKLSRPAAEPSTEPARTPCAPQNRSPAKPLAGRSNAASLWLSAGPRAELWRLGSGLGGQLALQLQRSSAFAAIRMGYLVAVPNSKQFSAHEVPFSAQLGWQPPGLLGLRGALSVGLSVFGATPEAGVSAQGNESSTAPFLGVELSRPVALGAFAVLPEVGASAFSSARWVKVDGKRALALPALVVQAGLSLALRVGG